MVISYAGMTHLGQTHRMASTIKGFEVVEFPAKADLVFVSYDVNEQFDLIKLMELMSRVTLETPEDVPIIVMSQVSPGFTRQWINHERIVCYQLDTIIMDRALERVTNPEQIVIGWRDDGPLPKAYQDYLDTFKCPIRRMSLESAELCKLAINFVLGAQISAANTLEKCAKSYGADYDDVEKVLRGDARIGPTAYVHPGVIGGHLPRDIKRIQKLLRDDDFANAIGPLA